MSEKRKKNFLSMEDKLKAIQRLDSGESAKKIAAELGVGKSTVGDWKKNRSEIEKWCSNQSSSSGIKIRKTMKKSDHPQVEEALFLWHEFVRSKGLPVSGPLLREKAIKFKIEIEGEGGDFTASEGWMDRWKKRFGVRQLTVSGEALSADKTAVPNFKTFLFDLLDKEGISGDQIYNCDETGLNYRMLPTKTLASKKESATPGYKKNKDRVTVLACSNATGTHKLRLTVIGKSKKPRAFKNIKNMETLPVCYTSQKKAWMNSELFKTWFDKEFVPTVEDYLAKNNLPRKAILIIDNAPSHPAADILQNGDIKTLFLPANVTSICQPMDQGVLEALKKKYRRRLLGRLCTAIDNNEDIIGQIKKIDMLDVITWISDSWQEISPVSIVRSWKALLDHKASHEWDIQASTEPDGVESDNVELVSLLEKIPGCETACENDLSEWFSNDAENEITDDDIIAMVTNATAEDTADKEEEEEESKISHSVGMAAIDTALSYISQQDNVLPGELMSLRKWRDYAARNRAQRQKQTTVKDFFTQMS